MTNKALVNKIIDSSVVDGPGNRTAIFLQGCNYRCTYCHNPETINVCCGCGECVKQCPVGALSVGEDGSILWDEKLCVKCDSCLKVCPNLSSPRVKLMSVEDVMAKVRYNAPFIKGITTSGGECTLNRDFLFELFTEAKKLGLSCLIDSNGSYDFSGDCELMTVCDGVMLDFKAEGDLYRDITSADGSGVLGIAKHLAAMGKLTEIRTVCSPSFNSEQTVRAACEALRDLQQFGDIHYRIIGYRRFGVREPYRSEIAEPGAEFMSALGTLAESLGMTHVSVV